MKSALSIFLKHEELIVAGRFAKFNLMQDKLKESNNILTRKMDKIFCILDTDVVNISNLLFNLKKLADICPKNIFTLIQNRNFEDELKFLLNCNDLGKFFKLKYSTGKDLKTYLAQTINYSNYITKEILTKYCSRAEEFQEDFAYYTQNARYLKIVSFEKCM